MPLVRSLAACSLLWIASREAPAFAGDAGDLKSLAAGLPPMRVFTARETGVTTMAWSAAQDASGRMYFGCDTVVSFDGDRWRQEKMGSTYLVRGLDAGPNGRVWAAGVNQIGWFEPGPKGLEYHSLVPRLPPGTGELRDVWRVYAEPNDSAIFVARDRILRWDGSRMSSWDYPGSHLLWSTRTATAVYVHYPPLGLLRIDAAGPALVVPASVLGAGEIGWLDDSGEEWLMLTSQGFKTLHDGVCTPLATEASAFARANTATSVVRLADGTLAIGTLKAGIALVDRAGAVLRVFNTRSGFPGNEVYSLFADRDGALWAMGPSNIVRLAIRSGTAVYGQRSGYPAGGCDAMADSSGSIIAASHSSLLQLSGDAESGGAGQFTALGVTSNRFFSLLAMPRGLAVGHVRGLGIWTPQGGLQPVPRLDNAVFRVNPSESHPGRLLASLPDRVLSVDPGTGDSSVVADSLPDYGDTVAEESTGRIWIGTPSRGLFVAGPGATGARPAGPEFGPLPDTGPILVARAGRGIVALANSAAFFLEAGAERFRPVSGVPAGNPISLSVPDSNGAVWAAVDPDMGAHSPKLGRIILGTGGARWEPQSLEGIAEIGSMLDLRMTPRPGHDELWIMGTDALLRATAAAMAPRALPRRPEVKAVVMDEGQGPGAAVSGALPYSTRGLHIEYCSLDYGMRESERFQTMLGGAETQWSPPTNSTDRDVSGLREGSYDFRVRLVTDSGEAGEPAVFHFDIAPPWWRTPLARAAMALAAILAVLAVLRLRTRSLKRRAQMLERMVRQRTEELQKANAAKTEFVASMSHEIRNPMGGILASALELSETPLGSDQQRLVTTIRSCATFLASLVVDVLDFAAIEAGAYKVALSPFSPREILDNIVTMLEPRAAKARMHASVDPELPERIVGDAARIQQVIVNFAANSLKFGGRKVWLSARSEGPHVVFAVADDGVGIPLEEQKNLFIRFSRLKSARIAAIPGTGLGLAVSRALADAMGGTVGFTTEPGRGSTFFLRLPLEAGAAVAQDTAEFNARGARALVVEDIEYNARALGLMLGRLGFDVAFALDGDEALARLAESTYQAVFIDCDLPSLDGIEVARRFRAREAPGKRALVVATTALSTAEDRDACIAAGMDAFVSKPITPEKLRAALGARPLAGAAPEGQGGAELPGYRLDLILHLADGSAAAVVRELASYSSSLDEAMQGVAKARASDSRSAVSSAAHRVLSLARMVGADALAATATDIQDFAAAYTEAELGGEISILTRHADELRGALARHAQSLPLSPSLAS